MAQLLKADYFLDIETITHTLKKEKRIQNADYLELLLASANALVTEIKRRFVEEQIYAIELYKRDPDNYPQLAPKS